LDGGTRKAIDEVMTPILQADFRSNLPVIICDPANPKGDHSGSTATDILHECGYQNVHVAPGNNRLSTRINAVSKFFRVVGAYVIDPSCEMIIGGLEGGYVFQKDVVASKTVGKDVYKDKKLDNQYAHFVDSLQNVCLFLSGKDKTHNTPPPQHQIGGHMVGGQRFM